jgi:hypothetical protein
VIVEKLESPPCAPELPLLVVPTFPPAPTVTVIATPLETANPVAVLKPPAPPPPE